MIAFLVVTIALRFLAINILSQYRPGVYIWLMYWILRRLLCDNLYNAPSVFELLYWIWITYCQHNYRDPCSIM